MVLPFHKRVYLDMDAKIKELEKKNIELTNKLTACNNVKNKVNRTNRLLHAEIDRLEETLMTMAKQGVKK